MSVIKHGIASYREARKSLRTPSAARSRRGLDWMNFFIADVQTGFGTFVAFYLAQLGWSQGDVGIALTVGGLAGVAAQIPGGALADAVTWKRGLAASGIVMIGAAALIIAFVPSFLAILFAETLHGLTAGIITPAIAAISLGLVGRQAMSLRTGRNFRYAAGGHAATAALMGFAGSYFSKNAIFVAAALLCLPALAALSYINGDEIDYSRARNAASGKRSHDVAPIWALAENRKLVLFAGALVLFQLADASILPLIGENLAKRAQQNTSMWMSALIIVPQIVVAIFAPWVGYHSEKKGRRPLLLIGFAAEPIRAAILAFTSTYAFVVAAAARWHLGCYHWRFDNRRPHRLDRGNGSVQSRLRTCRCFDRHRRIAEHGCDGLCFPRIRTHHRISDHRVGSLCRNHPAMDVFGRNEASELYGLTFPLSYDAKRTSKPKRLCLFLYRLRRGDMTSLRMMPQREQTVAFRKIADATSTRNIKSCCAQASHNARRLIAGVTDKINCISQNSNTFGLAGLT